MIRDIRKKVRVRAVLLDQYAVFIIAESRGTEPSRAVFFIDVAFFAERFKRLVDFSILVQ